MSAGPFTFATCLTCRGPLYAAAARARKVDPPEWGYAHLADPDDGHDPDRAPLPARLVNAAEWADEAHGRPAVPEGHLVANAPRPLAGQPAWTGPFRHGTLYAAADPALEPWKSWARDDGELILPVTNDELAVLVAAKAAEYGYATFEALEADGITVAEVAWSLQLPWHEAEVPGA